MDVARGEPPGDICVYFEPTGTVIRLFGRVDCTMRKELLEAALDVVAANGQVRIDIAAGAGVDPGALRFLRHASGLGGMTVVDAQAQQRVPPPRRPAHRVRRQGA